MPQSIGTASIGPASISAARLAGLVEGFGRSPAYAGLAESLTLLIGDGRIALAARLPSERDLSVALRVSRTTVTRAYATLVEAGYAEARQGAGTFTRVPGDRRRALDRALMPGGRDGDVIDLNCAAASAPPGVAAAYAEAVADLPAYLGGHGYFPAGLPRLQEAIAQAYDARGLPTRPEQVMVTAGALSASAIVAQALTRRGARVLVETPTYPNGVDALRIAGARLVGLPVAPDGWDLDGLEATLRQARPTLASLIPDFQNPTGLVMQADERERVAAALRRSGTVPIVDEAHQALMLDGDPMPPPFAAFAPETITIGSASKSFWGGLRIGWIRVPDSATMRALTHARVRLDLGAPVLEQLAFARLLDDPWPVVEAHRARLREQRAALVAAVSEQLPEWTFRVPRGGLCLWCRLPEPLGTDVAVEAERRGAIVAPGPVFAPEGGLDHFVRIPWSRPAEELEAAVGVLAESWRAVQGRRGGGGRPTDRMIVA
ncbi:PLP-dependent aminotransferase family protein [Nocardioides panacihumi]|uniref:PLP-dependent aminotransferase family protein n=1 Tax=Nocardioides panacihumi TaxID=400774 RepID=A0ABN2QWP8_9ACTN